jgi:trans-2,3-dihydro-3-hydroxyanthranilate isomerase
MSHPADLLAGERVLDYVIVDVFVGDRARPFEGNPLAVVLGADELTTEQCQALAVEFNLSETVFPMAPTVAKADYRARIFTIASELPFAGHPSVGAAWVLAALGRLQPGVAIQECPVGLVSLDIPAGDGPVRLTGAVPDVSGPLDPLPLLEAVGLLPDDLAGPPPRRSGTGISFAFLSVRPEALARARPNLAGLAALDPDLIGVQVLAVAPPAGEPFGKAPLAVRARVFVGDINGEDPATGSAAIALGGWLVASNLAEDDGETRYTITQGVEMGRPSVLACDVTARGGAITRVRVSGRVVVVATGHIRVP